jgi:oxygen-independent coproporphyrinogen-3 oxidase
VFAYLDALAEEAANLAGGIAPAETLYIGGGTPTVLDTAELRLLFRFLRTTFEVTPDAEITIEANPDMLTPAKAEALAACGVNRVSLGAQSFVDSELSLLGRSHGAQDILRAFSVLRRSGMDNLSLDLIYALPGQSHETWRHSLARAIELKPEHLSTYCLTFEPATRFGRSLRRGEIEKQSDEEEAELYETARELLVHAGYEHYEISNFALPGRRSLHNTVYWSNEQYLGLGASAVSYLGDRRITNLREPAEYIRAVESRGNAAGEIDEIPHRMQAVETMIQRLRLREGIDCAAFTKRFGFPPEDMLGDSLGELLELGLLEHDGTAIRCSLSGWHLANEVALRILPQPS